MQTALVELTTSTAHMDARDDWKFIRHVEEWRAVDNIFRFWKVFKNKVSSAGLALLTGESLLVKPR